MDHAKPIDYLLIGHITRDLTPLGPALGGTASYAARTAQAFGLRVGLVTSARAGEPLLKSSALAGVQIVCLPAAETTTFTNVYRGGHRRQILSARARVITADDIPPAWMKAPIVHLGPLDAEIDTGLAGQFPGAFVGVTPQGWLRQWDDAGVVRFCCWERAAEVLPLATTVVMSREDVHGDQELIDAYAHMAPMLVITLGVQGADAYIGGHVHHVPTRTVKEVDPTGAGDIFAAAFFALLHRHGDPINAARVACHIATTSITRLGLLGAPTPQEAAEAVKMLDLKE